MSFKSGTSNPKFSVQNLEFEVPDLKLGRKSLKTSDRHFRRVSSMKNPPAQRAAALLTPNSCLDPRRLTTRMRGPSSGFQGLLNFAASITTFVLISLSFAVYLPSSHVNCNSNGNLMPPTSR